MKQKYPMSPLELHNLLIELIEIMQHDEQPLEIIIRMDDLRKSLKDYYAKECCDKECCDK